MSAWKTKRTSGLSTPMPKAIVAHITTPSSCRKASWLCERTSLVEAGVIGQRAPALAREFPREFLGAPARGAIDDAALAAMLLERSASWRVALAFGPHREEEVRPVERAHEHARRAHETAARRYPRASARRPSPSPRSSARRRALRATSRRRRYSGRKSWPHCETQWASSIANRSIGACCSISSVSSRVSRSGAT